MVSTSWVLILHRDGVDVQLPLSLTRELHLCQAQAEGPMWLADVGGKATPNLSRERVCLPSERA